MRATVTDILSFLKSKGSPRNVAGMARYGIVAVKAYGAPTAVITGLARTLGRNHSLALQLWDAGVYDARILAALIEEPEQVTSSQMERWVLDFDNWAICDGVCLHLFDRTPFAHAKAAAWSRRKGEFVRRAGFALMAVLSVHDKEAPDRVFRKYLSIIMRTAADDRAYVKKAVNWALRQIGKRNLALNGAAISAARQILRRDSPAARWIARDALRELQSAAVQKRLQAKEGRHQKKAASSPPRALKKKRVP